MTKINNCYKKLAADVLRDLERAFGDAKEGFQSEVGIKILPGGRTYFVSLSRSRKISTSNK